MQPLEEVGRSVPGPAARKVIDVAELEVRGLKSVVTETRLGVGVAQNGVGNSDAVVGGLYSTDEDVAAAEQGPAGYDGDDAVATPLISVTVLPPRTTTTIEGSVRATPEDKDTTTTAVPLITLNLRKRRGC